MGGAIRIRELILDEIVEQARRTPRNECCGLLAGREGVINRAFPATNAARDSATSYEIAPEELFRFMRAIREAGLEFLGIYHSHPIGPNEPSARDNAQAFYPDAAYFIISPEAATPAAEAVRAVRAFSIRGGKTEELLIEVL